MIWLVRFLCLCSSFAITSADGTWKLVRNEKQDKVSCDKLNQGADRNPKYDDVYDTAEKCKSACLTQVPQCNTVNYAPNTTQSDAKRGKCQFEYCKKGFGYALVKGFNSYMNVDANGDPALPGNWMKVRDAKQTKVDCDKLNKGTGAAKPKYDSDYTNLEDCKKACLTQVLGCNTVNFSPIADPQVVKAGKCQFENCKNDYKIHGTKHFDSYIFSGNPLAIATTTTTALWTKLQDSNKKFNCEHKNSKVSDTPRYGDIYDSLGGCQNACVTKVTECNAVNYAPINVKGRARRGKCEFQYCDFRGAVDKDDTNSFEGYQFNGEPLHPTPTTPQPTRPQVTQAPIDYDRDGWGMAGDPREKQLDCRKVNADANHDTKNGPPYGIKYPGAVYKCKLACQKLPACDAINYNSNDGTCQFQDCNGVVVRGENAGFISFLYRAPRTTVATRKPRTCLSTCKRNLDCEDLMANNRNILCTTLESQFRDCSCTGCNCPDPWRQVANTTQKKLDCVHLNTRVGSSPAFNSIYPSLQACQDACTNKVEDCNAVSYAPANAFRSVKGTCEFHKCDRVKKDYRFFGGYNFNSYVYYGPTVRPGSRTPVRRPEGSTRAPVTGQSRLWTQVQTVDKSQLYCEHLHTSPRTSPTFNSVFSSLAACKSACQNQVPSCNAINYAPAAQRGTGVEKGTCQFQYCDQNTNYTFVGAGGFQSFIFNGVPLRDTRPPPQTTRRGTYGTTTTTLFYDRLGWRRVGALTEFDLGCKKLNDGGSADPQYGAKYDTLALCKAACKDKVAGCDAVNYNRDKVCQFQQCNGVVVSGKEKSFESFMMRPRTTTTAAGCQSTCVGGLTCDQLMKQSGSTCLDLEHKYSGCSCTGCRCPQPWEQLRNVDQEKLDCNHINTRPKDNPRSNTVYSTLKKCRDACTSAVPGCNSVNYAPAAVSKRITKGKCEFMFCDPDYEYVFFGTKHYNSYVWNGPKFTPTTIPATTPKLTTTTARVYGTDGWAQVGTESDHDLRCIKLNTGQNHDVKKNGPRYDTKYDTLDKCKVACRDQVRGCDAINYSKLKGGKCQFQLCKGVVTKGKVKNFNSYFLKPGVATTPKPIGCRTTCIGFLTCDDVIKRQSGTETCESLTKANCDCTGCECPIVATTTTTPKLITATEVVSQDASNPTPACKSNIDCKGNCDGKAHVDACGVCEGTGTCTAFTKDDVRNRLNSIVPKDSHAVAVAKLKPYLSLARGIFSTKDLVQTDDSFTVYIRLVGYSKAAFRDSDNLHLRNYFNAQTTVALSKITIVDVKDAPPARWRRLQENKVQIPPAVDITMRLDVSQIHDADYSKSNPDKEDRTGTVVAIVVVIVIIAALLVAGVVIGYRIMDNKKQRNVNNKTLEMEMSDISPRKSNQYIQSTEPVLHGDDPARKNSSSPRKATVIVETPP